MVQQDEQTQQALSYMRHQGAKSLNDLRALIERTAADCARALEGVSEEQGIFKDGREWSIKEVLAHILDDVAFINRQIANLVKGRVVSPARRVGQTRGDERPIEEIRAAFADVWSDTLLLVGSLPENAGLEATRAHPWFGPLNFKQWIAFQRIHALDHVQQIEKVKAAPGYPQI